jgi:hypothetical protein
MVRPATPKKRDEMTIRIKSPATVPAGTYQAVFGGIEEKTSKRDGAPYFRWTFEARTPEGPKDVSGVSSINTGPKSKAYGWLAGLLGRKPLPDELLDETALAGSACIVVLEENDDGFANVVDVLPPARLSDATVAAYAEAADAHAAETDAQLDDLPF